MFSDFSPPSARSGALIPVLFLALFVLPGCFLFGSSTFEFKEGLEEIEPNKVPRVDLKPGDTIPRELHVEYDGEGDFSWAHGRGWLEASMSDLWEVLQNPDVLINRREVSEWSITTGVEEGYDKSWRAHNTVYHTLATVPFQQTYRMNVVTGTVEKPEEIMVRAELTELDHPLKVMELISDSLIAYELFDGVIEVEFIRHRKSMMNEKDGALAYIQDIHATLQAVLEGKDLPDWDSE